MLVFDMPKMLALFLEVDPNGSSSQNENAAVTLDEYAD